jgi:hypothetical protein
MTQDRPVLKLSERPTPEFPMRLSPLAAWHDAVAANDLSHIDDLLADDAVFQSPAVRTPQVGKALVAKYLRAAMVVLNNDSFRYVDAWEGPDSAVLEFEVTLGGVYVNGVDLIRWNSEGLIVQFKVMLRPLKALNAVIPMMGRELERAAADRMD